MRRAACGIWGVCCIFGPPHTHPGHDPRGGLVGHLVGRIWGRSESDGGRRHSQAPVLANQNVVRTSAIAGRVCSMIPVCCSAFGGKLVIEIPSRCAGSATRDPLDRILLQKSLAATSPDIPKLQRNTRKGSLVWSEGVERRLQTSIPERVAEPAHVAAVCWLCRSPPGLGWSGGWPSMAAYKA